MDLKMMKKAYRFAAMAGYGLLLIAAMSSCKSTKLLTDKTFDENLTARTIIRNHYKNQVDFRTLTGKLRISYSDGESSQTLGVSLRMEKDKAIWLSAPLGVVKAIITPGRVSFYNKLENNYFDGSFEYLSKLLGTELDFKKVQNLLLGEALYDLRDEKYEVSTNTSTYELKPVRSLDLFKILFTVNPNNFKLASQQISQPLQKRLLEIRYKDYQEKNKKIVPNTVGIVAIDNDQRNVIDIEYRNIEFNTKVSFPYKIPSGYEKIVLN
ncbi:DUF4292 domain-containing protein [Muriicola jejuensis]|nr:DUF4292 domain-containing protein [Muriicola jejuensis]